MTYYVRMIVAAVRVALFAGTALTLAGCQTDSGSPAAGDAPKPGFAGAPQAAKPSQPDAEPMTHTRAARECWMRTEKGGARENLDKRADIVDKCIEDKMKAASGPAPKS